MGIAEFFFKLPQKVLFKRRRVRMGKNSSSNSNYLWNVIVGNNVRIARNAHIKGYGLDAYNKYYEKVIIIEDGAFIGYNTYIKEGVRIGKNAIVGAFSLVLEDVPPNAIVYGIPARIHGYRDSSSGN